MARFPGKRARFSIPQVALVILATLLILGSEAFAAQRAPTITNLAGLRETRLAPGEQSRPVRLQATVTYSDPEWKLLFLQDGTGSGHATGLSLRLDLGPGDLVAVEGNATPASTNNPVLELRAERIRQLGDGPPPSPVAITGGALLSAHHDGQTVEVKGEVRSVLEQGRLRLDLLADGRRIAVWAKHHEAADLARLLDAKVTVQGVCNQALNPRGQVNAVTLYLTSLASVKVDQPGPADPYALPLTAISQVLATQPAAGDVSRIRLRGNVVRQNLEHSLQLRDGTGELLVQSIQPTPLAVEDVVEVIGFPTRVAGGMGLTDAQFRVVQRATAEAVAAQADPSLPTLTSISEVHRLTRDQARQRFPVKLTAVATYANLPRRQLLVQEGDEAIYVELGAQDLNVRKGQRLRITGVTTPGGVLTMLTPTAIEVLAEHALVPAAVPMSYQQGMTGDYDCRHVRVKGTVQSVLYEEGLLNLDLAATDGRFYATVPVATNNPLCTNLVNCIVEVEGVCILNINELGLPKDIELAINGEQDIHVQERAPGDAYSIPTQRIGDVLRFIPSSMASRRLKVQGTVTLRRPGRELYLQDESGAIRALTTLTNLPDVGDEVELLGYRVQGEVVAEFQHAEFRPVRRGQPVTPLPLEPEAALSATNHGMLVQMEARLAENAPGGPTPELVLQSDQGVFIAAIEEGPPGRVDPGWQAGTQLRLTGVCYLQADETRNPRSFRLLVRSPADVQVLQRPSWFTPRRVLGLSIIPVLAALLSLGWIQALRRVVARQTDLIRQQLMSETAAQQRLALVWETSTDGMRLTDATGVAVRVNAAYCRLMRLPREALEGQAFTVAYGTEPPAAALARFREEFDRRRPAPRQEVEAVLSDGAKVWFELTNVFLEHPGSPPLLLSQFRDITERKLAEAEREKLQDQLLQARKTESIGRLAGGVAHDFNNMLQVILGNAMLALEEDATPELVRESLQQIHSSAQRSADLTRQLLAFARRQAATPKVLDLNGTVAGTLGMLRRLIGEHIHLAFTPGAELWPVKIDPAQLDQILVNLTVNARDAIEGTGRISLGTANTVVDGTLARTELDCASGDYVVLSIADTGHGIDAETRQHLFEPFYTTKEQGKGTGLGLATVFGIVRQNRGAVSVRSEPGRGATFQIYLPRVQAPVADTEAPKTRAPSRGDETILLVEDEEQVLHLGRRILAQQGYTVLEARTPEEAIALVSRHQGPIHVLVTDVVMPHMNGRQLRDALERLRPRLPTIFISGYTADIVAHHGVLDDGVHLLQKPFTAETLTAKIREVLGGHDRRG